jgi:formylmethanofuran dehydrogenase subunit E
MVPTQDSSAMTADTCDRCGQLFPHTEESQDGRTFCEPCRDALWRDERGLGSADEATG